MAAIMYGYMNYKFGLGTDTLKNGQYPTTLRYIDWIVTTPLIVLKFPQLLGSDEKGNSIATLVIVADVIMVLFGYIGETAINATLGTDFNLIGFAMFGVSMLAWMFIFFTDSETVFFLKVKKWLISSADNDLLQLQVYFGQALI